jgi:hypothetical protein
MSERKNEPAFPVEGNDVIYFGMSIREHFASICLQGLLANPDRILSSTERLVNDSVNYANMLLKALDN